MTTKCKIKLRKSETLKDYYIRCSERVETYQFFIPKDSLNPKNAYDQLMLNRDIALKMRTKKLQNVPQNFNSCFEWNRSCEWYSQCFGHLFSETPDLFNVVDSTDITSMLEDNEFDFL